MDRATLFYLRDLWDRADALVRCLERTGHLVADGHQVRRRLWALDHLLAQLADECQTRLIPAQPRVVPLSRPRPARKPDLLPQCYPEGRKCGAEGQN